MSETVYEQFRQAALAGMDSPFLCIPSCETREYLPAGASFSYGEGLALTDRLAGLYQAAGYRPGHRVALFIGNRAEHFWHLLALNKLGASIVPLNPDYLPHELAFGIEFAGCALVVAAGPRLEEARAVAGGLAQPVTVVDARAIGNALPAPAHLPAAVAGPVGDREAVIIYTSGTTGRPKGCSISNTSCLAAGESYGEAGGLIHLEHGKERVYIPLPAFHMNVTVYTLNTVTRTRNCIILQDRFRAGSWWSDIVATGATAVHYLGIIPPLLLKAPPSEMDRGHKVKFGKGAGVDPVIRDAFEARFGFPLVEAWGMTETSRAIQNSALPRCLTPRAFGKPRPPFDVMIADDHDAPVPAGTPGELLVRSIGPNPRHGFFSGYLNQPEETEQAWRNGWFHTGDLVRQLPDGMLVFVERRKNIIRRSGENIAAAEVEEGLIENPDIQSVAVIPVPDDFHDEEVMACVVLMPEVAPSPAQALRILERAQGRLSRAKLPGWIAFVGAIPVTGTQKVQKGQIFAHGTDPRQDARTVDVREFKRRKLA